MPFSKIRQKKTPPSLYVFGFFCKVPALKRIAFQVTLQGEGEPDRPSLPISGEATHEKCCLITRPPGVQH